MSIIKVKRAWKTDANTRTNYFVSTYSVMGIPFLKVKRTGYRTFYLFGIPIYKENQCKQSIQEATQHLLGVTIDVHEMPKASGLLRTFQLAELEFLKKVDRACKKHGIRYWLDFGTMLGAVRHKGFIPWDDDVGIAMLRGDYEKFLSILNQEFPDEIYTTNSVGFLQIHIKGTMLQIDVFVYDQAPDSWFPEGKTESDFIQKVYNAAEKMKFNILFQKEQKECIENFTYEDRKQLTKKEILNNREAAPDGNIFRGIEVPVGKRFSMKHEWIFPLKEIEYEGLQFPVPQYTEAVLFQYYGNWESIPSNPSYHFNMKDITLSSYLRLKEIIKRGL